MTSALIPPVIPRRSAPGNWPRGRPGAAGTLPLPASPGQAPALAADVVYGLGRIDASGRGGLSSSFLPRRSSSQQPDAGGLRR